MKINGYYNELGYVVSAGTTNVYTAGNSPTESQTYLSINHPYRLPLETIKEYCQISVNEQIQDNPRKYKSISLGQIKYVDPRIINPETVAYQIGMLTR